MILLAVAIIFSSQIATTEKVFAADVYVYTEGRIEYYITYKRTMFMAVNVKGVSKGQVVKKLSVVFNQSNGEWLYQIQDQTSGMSKNVSKIFLVVKK